MTDREAYIILNMLSGIGPARMSQLLDSCGTPAEIFERDIQSLAAIPHISEQLAERIVNWCQYVNLEQELELADKAGVNIFTRDEDEYPQILREVHDAPLCLYVRGKIPDAINHRSIAIVGTRNMSNYGSMMARHLSEAAGYTGWVVVSGLACGIDTVAHTGVLDTPEGETVAVLGGGLMRVHPQENLALARKISQHGAVISEFPMQFSPTRRSFPMRNRIISGLSMGTLIVEAGLNSGSLITAALALEQGRRVFAVPGQADRAQANGCNRLIKQGAVLVETFEHILEEFDFLPGFRPDKAGNFSENNELAHDDFFGNSCDSENDTALSSVDIAILDLLRKGDLSVDEITNNVAFPASQVMSALIALEILSRVKKSNDGRYHRIR